MKEYRKNHSKIRIPAKQNNNLFVPPALIPEQETSELSEQKIIIDNGKRFTVKVAQWVMEKFKDQDTPTRKVVDLGTNLTWVEAKKMAKDNKHSWIVG